MLQINSEPVRKLVHDRMTKAFNEWMRRYTEHPEEFAGEFQSVTQFLTESADGKEPTYGDNCAAYFTSLLDEIPFPEQVPA
jgi:hypothetical protein